MSDCILHSRNEPVNCRVEYGREPYTTSIVTTMATCAASFGADQAEKLVGRINSIGSRVSLEMILMGDANGRLASSGHVVEEIFVIGGEI